MGLTSSGDIFCQCTDKALAGIPDIQKLVDDILITGKTKKELLERIEMVFKRCQDRQITLSKTKQRVGNKVKFAGFVVSDEGTEPDPDKVAAIRDFPVPQTLTYLRSFFSD